jgi:hypothetical protein
MLFPSPTFDINETPSIQSRWTSWIRTALFVICTAVLLISLYWKLALTSIPHQLITPESHDNVAYTVRDLPGRGKGMIAVRDIRVSTIPGFRKPTLIGLF